MPCAPRRHGNDGSAVVRGGALTVALALPAPHGKSARQRLRVAPERQVTLRAAEPPVRNFTRFRPMAAAWGGPGGGLGEWMTLGELRDLVEALSE
ncbi:MAG: hypothetical protein KF791_17325 [Verrucomicrobiae bacterium]|nr:hypothetical protein [Verrucomicrobiae bacterium]